MPDNPINRRKVPRGCRASALVGFGQMSNAGGHFAKVVRELEILPFLAGPVGDLSITEAIHLQNVMRQAHQCPLGPYLLNSPKVELSESASMFDLSEHRFDDRLSSC